MSSLSEKLFSKHLAPIGDRSVGDAGAMTGTLQHVPFIGIPQDTYADEQLFESLYTALTNVPMKDVITVILKSAGSNGYDAAVDSLYGYATAGGIRIVLCEADGTAKLDTAKTAAFVKDPLNKGTPIHENLATRSVIRRAIDGMDQLVQFEQKFSNTLGKIQTYAATRISRNYQKATGAIRVSADSFM